LPPTTHTTESGDTYSSIAFKYGVTVEQSKIWNKFEGTSIPQGVELIVNNPM